MILLLAGTAEARDVARRLAAEGLAATASLAGAAPDPRPLALPVRSGGFGGADGFRRYLADAGVRAVIDATHPFAARISDRTADICTGAGIPCLRLQRPGWVAGPGDRWTRVAGPGDLGVVPDGARVFLAVGRQELDRYAGLARCHVAARGIAPPVSFPFPRGRFLTARPPFDPTCEAALFRDLRIDWLVAKDAGGCAGRAKLDAARAIGIPVALIARPPVPRGVPVVADAAAALDWARTL